MKYKRKLAPLVELASRPTRGAWIEIQADYDLLEYLLSRAPHGARGLKFNHANALHGKNLVAPHTGRVD